jgi:hypothetical protein
MGDHISLSRTQNSISTGLSGLLFGTKTVQRVGQKLSTKNSSAKNQSENDGTMKDTDFEGEGGALDQFTLKLHDSEIGGTQLKKLLPLVQRMRKWYGDDDNDGNGNGVEEDEATIQEKKKNLNIIDYQNCSWVSTVHSLDSTIYQKVYQHLPYAWYMIISHAKCIKINQIVKDIKHIYTFFFPKTTKCIKSDMILECLNSSSNCISNLDISNEDLGLEIAGFEQPNQTHDDKSMIESSTRVLLFYTCVLYSILYNADVIVDPIETNIIDNNPTIEHFVNLNFAYNNVINNFLHKNDEANGNKKTIGENTLGKNSDPNLCVLFYLNLMPKLLPKSLITFLKLKTLSPLTINLGFISMTNTPYMFKTLLPQFCGPNGLQLPSVCGELNRIGNFQDEKNCSQIITKNISIISQIMFNISHISQESTQAEAIAVGFDVLDNSTPNLPQERNQTNKENQIEKLKGRKLIKKKKSTFRIFATKRGVYQKIKKKSNFYRVSRSLTKIIHPFQDNKGRPNKYRGYILDYAKFDKYQQENVQNNKPEKKSDKKTQISNLNNSLRTFSEKLTFLRNLLISSRTNPGLIPHHHVLRVKSIVLRYMITPLQNVVHRTQNGAQNEQNNYNFEIEQIDDYQNNYDFNADLNNDNAFIDDLVLQLSLQLGNYALTQRP